MRHKIVTLISLVVLILLIARLTAQAQGLECNPAQSICIGTITLSEGVGNPSGGIPGISHCPSVSALTGVEVKTNDYLRQARSSCNELLIDPISGSVTATGSSSNGEWIVNTPPGSLIDEQSTCPSGMAVVGYQSRSGLLVDGVQVICQSLSGNIPVGAFHYAAYVGGYGGSDNPPIFCPSEQVAVGIVGQAGDGLDYFGLQCAALYQPPVAEPGGPYTGDEGSPVAFDGSGSFDPNGDPLTYNWAWGDGTSSSNVGPTPNHTYDDNGEYQVCLMVTDPFGLSDTQCNPMLLFWDFENATSVGNVSTSVGTSFSPSIFGIASQTGGGPVAIFGGAGYVHLTRFLGLYHPYLEFTTDEPFELANLEFQHFHNHNFGYPTYPSYDVQLQIDTGSGFVDIGSPLTLNAANSGNTDSLSFGSLSLSPGAYSIRWDPRNLSGPHTGTEFFALNDVILRATWAVTIQNVAPTATFNAPTEANAGSDFDLSLTNPYDPSSADTAAGFEYAFDCGNGIFSGWSGVSTVTCSTPDTVFTARGKIRDKDGGETEYSADVLVNYPPVAEPGGPYSGDEGSPVAFDGSGSSDPNGDPLTYDWDWGDGTSSLDAGPTPSHIYDDNGLYKICLTVTDPLGLADTQCAVGNFESGDLAEWDVSGTVAAVTSHEGVEGLGLVSLGREPPPPNVISAASTYTPMAGTYFALLTTGCPEEPTTLARTFQATAGDTISGWAFFDAGDAMPFDDNAKVTIKQGNSVLDTVFSASVATVGNYGEAPWTYWEYTFAVAGTYTLEASAVNFRDCDADSYLGLDMSGVNILNVAPTATFNAASPINAGEDFQLSLTSPIDPSLTDMIAGLEYAFDCGDGIYGAWSIVNAATCPAPDDTGLTVRGKIRDKDEGETEYSADVLVNPTAKFSATPIVGTPPLTVTFTDESMGAPSSWAWNFGDDGTSTEQHPSHTYITTGTFTVTLTVSNTVGSDTMTDTNCVSVVDQLPEPPTYPVYLPIVIKDSE